MRLKKIDDKNWRTCIELSVLPEQRRFIIPNCILLLEAQYGQHIYPFGIYKDEEMVGLVLYDRNPDNKHWELRNIMIDQKKQGQGMGKKGLELLIEKMHREHRKALFYAYIDPDNLPAKKTYESVGFKVTGIKKDEKIEYSLQL